MAFITFKSSNKNLSWVLCKNPETGMQIKSTRQGFSFGWFNNEHYCLAFKDGLDKMSYSENPKAQYEYLDRNRYVHPMCYVNLINDNLRSAMKEEQEKDITSSQEIVLHGVEVKSASLLRHFKTHMKDVEITEEVLNDSLMKVTFRSEGTFHEILNHVLLCCLLWSGDMAYFLTKVDGSFVNKYVGIINKLELPYFIRYVFARNFFRGKESFDKFGSSLETDNIKLCHGDTQMQRLRFVESVLSFDKEILEIGCGEGKYALNFPKKLDNTYHAIDIDEDLLGGVQRRADARGYDVKTYKSLDNFLDYYLIDYKKVLKDVMLVEVIEHMPLKEAKELILKVLNNINFETFLITTPNQAFNDNYSLGQEFRHDDHDWEMNRPEFQAWIEGLLYDNSLVEYSFVDIGDTVDGEPTSQGVLIRSKNVPKRAVLTVGVSASGKTTWAEKFCERTKGWVNINRDDIRFQKFTRGERNWSLYKFDQRKEAKVWEEVDKRIERSSEKDYNIIISDTNLSEKVRQKLTEKLEGLGYSVEIKEFDITLEKAWERDARRENGVGHDVIYRQYKQWMQYKGSKQYTPDNTLPPTAVFDLDGTTAQMVSRGPFEWDKVYQDDVRYDVRDMIWGYQLLGYRIVFASGRDECCRELTERWLKEVAEVEYDDLFMRPEGSMEKDTVIKECMLFEDIAPKYNVKLFVDDRPSVSRHLRMLGVNVISVGDPNIEF